MYGISKPLYYNINIKSKCKIKIKNSYCCSRIAIDSSKQSNNPFFSILNESGVVKYFINAIVKNSEEEAKSCISKFVVDKVDLSEIYSLLGEKKQYKSLIKYNKNDNKNTISVAVGSNDEIVHVKMIEEPDCNGNWKIIQIDRE